MDRSVRDIDHRVFVYQIYIYIPIVRIICIYTLPRILIDKKMSSIAVAINTNDVETTLLPNEDVLKKRENIKSYLG